MNLTYDPGDGKAFWEAIRQIPGYPQEEEMPIQMMLFETGALFRLSEVMQKIGADRGQPVLVVMDHTPMQRGPESLKPMLLNLLKEAGWLAEPVWMEPDATGQVHTDMPHIDEVLARLRSGVSVVAVGSGTICDIAKHACYLFQQEHASRLPFLVYQTANSVSAYTSNMAPTFIEGVKRTLASRYPDALICDLETLVDAPRAMTVSGVGDLLAAFVSFPDWHLAHQLGMDPGYSQLPQSLIGPLDKIFLAQAESIRTASTEGMAVLAKLIALGGLAMSLSHATTPMSGFEHVMSHVLDMIAEQAGKPLAQHGSQVALASILGAEVYQRFFDDFEPAEVNLDSCYPSPETMQASILQAFASIDPSGKVGEECWADYKIKLAAWQAHKVEFGRLLKDWPIVRSDLAAYSRSPERLVQILRAINAPLTFAELEPPAREEQVKFAFMHASLMRRRLTIGDLLIFLNWDREKLWRKAWTLVRS